MSLRPPSSGPARNSDGPPPAPAPRGDLAIVLHAHLPFVRHPEYRFFLEEDWYYEALSETYLPVLRRLHSLRDRGVPYRLTLSLTPPLMSMMGDPVLAARYERHLRSLTQLGEKELRRTRERPVERRVAEHYREELEATWAAWRRWDGRVLEGFRDLLESGHLEVLTSGATHGYLPLLREVPTAVRAQIAAGVQCYEQFMGRAPRGIWLPECGYYPGLDGVLAEHGLRYFLTDAHGVLFASPRPRYGNYAPLVCEGSGVVAFGRDLETAHQVWSREQGYPGDPWYREFYRDVGYDLDLDYIGPWVQPDGTRKNTGFKYHRITGPGATKAWYDPGAARERARMHAGNFMFNRERQIEHLAETLGQPPLVVAAYDAELFGHWWYEGPDWLAFLVEKIAREQQVFRLTHALEVLRRAPRLQVARPAESSWGDHGYHEFWLNDRNAWIYPHLHKAARRMAALVRRHPSARGLTRRALAQAGRELLLAQSSDWAFIMKSGTMVEYAERRTRAHLRRFTRLWEDLQAARVEPRWLAQLEALDNIFPELDYRIFGAVDAAS